MISSNAVWYAKLPIVAIISAEQLFIVTGNWSFGLGLINAPIVIKKQSEKPLTTPINAAWKWKYSQMKNSLELELNLPSNLQTGKICQDKITQRVVL